MRHSMRRRFYRMNQVAAGFLGEPGDLVDLRVDRLLERPGPTSGAREVHLRDGQVLRWVLRGGNSILDKDRMKSAWIVRATAPRSTNTDQLPTFAAAADEPSALAAA